MVHDRQAASVLDFIEQPFTDKLIELLDLLRYEHYYCFYCGIKYENERDLQSNCPGFFEEDH